MNVNLDSVRSRRIAALAILILLTLLGMTLIVGPVAAFIGRESHRHVAAEQELSERETLASNLPVLKALVDHIDAHPLWARLYTYSSEAPVSTQLQTDFRALSDAQSIQIDSFQPLAAEAEGEFSRVGLRVSFSTTIDHLSKLLLAMKSSQRLLRFEKLSIVSPQAQDASKNAPLTVRGDVVADVLGTAPP